MRVLFYSKLYKSRSGVKIQSHSRAFYTYRLTVFENCSYEKFLYYRSSHCGSKVSWSRARRRCYIREIVRIARITVRTCVSAWMWKKPGDVERYISVQNFITGFRHSSNDVGATITNI